MMAKNGGTINYEVSDSEAKSLMKFKFSYFYDSISPGTKKLEKGIKFQGEVQICSYYLLWKQDVPSISDIALEATLSLLNRSLLCARVM